LRGHERALRGGRAPRHHPIDFAQSVAIALAARDPELAGEVIEAVRLAVNMHPVTKIIPAKADRPKLPWF
jgi:hypothetical protein